MSVNVRDVDSIERGFPATLAPECLSVLDLLGAASHPASIGDTAFVQGESLQLPARTYFAEPVDHEFRELNDLQRVICRCVLSRHHDGRVRQQQIAPLANIGLQWVAPYVLALLADHVIEIHQELQSVFKEALRPVDRRAVLYAELIRENTKWWDLIQARVISYWNLHYRTKYPSLESYPASWVVAELSQLGPLLAGQASKSQSTVLGSTTE